MVVCLFVRDWAKYDTHVNSKVYEGVHKDVHETNAHVKVRQDVQEPPYTHERMNCDVLYYMWAYSKGG